MRRKDEREKGRTQRREWSEGGRVECEKTRARE
jgi:hypothetical protein